MSIEGFDEEQNPVTSDKEGSTDEEKSQARPKESDAGDRRH